jgi:putative endonuclease
MGKVRTVRGGTIKSWCLYLIECRNGHYYCGITNDLDARYQAHVEGRGARYTRANPPARLMGSRPYPDRASASRAEHAVKRLRRSQKLIFLECVEDVGSDKP